jgi:hypothetical protein
VRDERALAGGGGMDLASASPFVSFFVGWVSDPRSDSFFLSSVLAVVSDSAVPFIFGGGPLVLGVACPTAVVAVVLGFATLAAEAVLSLLGVPLLRARADEPLPRCFLAPFDIGVFGSAGAASALSSGIPFALLNLESFCLLARSLLVVE